MVSLKLFISSNKCLLHSARTFLPRQ
uniref:Uncharacterized protein n=1 Tax=Anguilla anguilla TaxID=7936 RepID=A0A0E9V3T1_ANGAN